MSTTPPRTSTEEQVLTSFVNEFEKASDPAAVVADYAARYPALAAGFAAFAGAQPVVRAALPPEPLPPAPRFAPGHRLGEFDIVELIGEGGMSEVYAARQERLGRTVALKVIRLGRVSAAARLRFDREQRVLAGFHQTHIVPIHTAGEEGDIQYFTMAYIRGAALSRVVDTIYDRARTLSGGQTPSMRELAASPLRTPHRTPRDATKVRLSADYFRSVADVLVQAAEAVQYAHDAKVMHRDIKPSNLMVDRVGHCWIIDFGLAGLCASVTASVGTAAGGLTHGPMGTPQYMAPEQFDGKPAFASDIWGLGATLYELLTLRRAFDGPTYLAIEADVRSKSPRPVRELVAAAPKDLAAICVKALAKNPTNRYATAGDLALDLRRWLNREPTTARPARVFRRVGLWSARNKGWAAAIACVVVAGVTLGLLSNAAARDRAATAAVRATAAEEKQEAAEQKVREQERGALLRRAADVRAGVRKNGWSEQAWELAVDANRRRSGPDARDEAASSLVGLDANLVKRWDAPRDRAGAGASGVAFSPDGRWVLAGGTGGEPTRLWNRETGEEKSFPFAGDGPVGFRPDGTAVRVLLPTKDRKTIQFRDLASDKALREFEPPGEPITVAKLATDAGLLAVASADAVTVWDTATGQAVRPIKTAGTAGLAFSPDGKLLAVGDTEGRVGLWPLPGGDPLPPLECGRTAVNALAFGRPLRPSAPGTKGGPNWRLAIGDSGGTVTVWELAPRLAVAICRGSQHAVHSVVFSPDGMHLASGGRFDVKLWDAASGKLLLSLIPPSVKGERNWITDLKFSPDGSGLSVGSVGQFEVLGGADVWAVQNGKGVRILRGLDSNVNRVAVSLDGKRIAALSHSWTLAVWDTERNQLLHQLTAPRGMTADNAAITFSPDGKRLAFSAGTEAVMWDVDSGRVRDRWKLPVGLTDAITFHPNGKVYLFRTDRDKFPRLCPLRELRPDGELREVCEPLVDFPRGCQDVTASPDGRYFVAKWWDDAKIAPDLVRAYDSATGDKLWPPAGTSVEEYVLDPTGKLLIGWDRGRKTTYLVDMPSGRLRAERQYLCGSFGPGAELLAVSIQDSVKGERSMTLLRSEGARRLVSIDGGVTIRGVPGGATFSSNGTHVVWTNEDGTVMVCDIPEVSRRLTGLGLDFDAGR